MVQMTLPDVYYICRGSVSTVKSCETGVISHLIPNNINQNSVNYSKMLLALFSRFRVIFSFIKWNYNVCERICIVYIL